MWLAILPAQEIIFLDILEGAGHPTGRTVEHTASKSGQVKHARIVGIDHRTVAPLEIVAFQPVPISTPIVAAEGCAVEGVYIYGGRILRVLGRGIDMRLLVKDLLPRHTTVLGT